MTKKEILERELEKIGIKNEEDLKRAIEELPPLDISIFAGRKDEGRKVS